MAITLPHSAITEIPNTEPAATPEEGAEPEVIGEKERAEKAAAAAAAEGEGKKKK